MVQFGCCGIAKKTKGKKLFVDTDLDDNIIKIYVV